MKHGDNARTKVNTSTNSHNNGTSQCVSQEEPDVLLLQEDNNIDVCVSDRLSVAPYV